MTDEFIKWIGSIFDKTGIEEYKKNSKIGEYCNPSGMYIHPIDLSEFNPNYTII